MTIQLVISLDRTELIELLHGVTAKSSVESKLDQLLQSTGAIRMLLEEFQAKIDHINANTTASAAAASAAADAATNASTAAQTIKTQLDDLRVQIQGMGLTADQETQLLSQLDSAATGTDAVKTAAEGIRSANTALADFLTATASGPTEPPPVPVPEPIPV